MDTSKLNVPRFSNWKVGHRKYRISLFMWHIANLSHTMNFIDLIFINFIVVIVILGALINFIEPYLPVFITQTFRYGKHSYKGAPNKIAQLSEIPKSYFKHFYVFALIWSILVMYLVTWAYVCVYPIPDVIITSLDLLCGRNREVKSTLNKTSNFPIQIWQSQFIF